MSWIVFENKIKKCFTKTTYFLLNEVVIWQASDSPLSKELHGHGLKLQLESLDTNQLGFEPQ